MKLKAGPPAHVKVIDEAKGEVEAVFSTLNVVDSDNDVTEPGAFGDQKVRISAYNHASWGNALPIGKGTISESGNEALLKSQFFMNTTGGRETFETIKALDDLMEWSYGYDVLEKSDGVFPKGADTGQQVRYLKKIKVHEVSPVILGAGVGTRTLSAKALKEELTGDDFTIVKRLINRLKERNQVDLEMIELLKVLETVASADDTTGIKLVNHLAWATKEMDVVVTRFADALAQRAEQGQTLSDSTMEEAQKLLTQQERLREALAIGPRKQTELPEGITESVFRNTRALLSLSGGSNGS